MLNERNTVATTLEAVLGPERVYPAVGSCGGTPVTSAGFNRRMRKTARPVVWKGYGAQSP